MTVSSGARPGALTGASTQNMETSLGGAVALAWQDEPPMRPRGKSARSATWRSSEVCGGRMQRGGCSCSHLKRPVVVELQRHSLLACSCSRDSQ